MACGSELGFAIWNLTGRSPNKKNKTKREKKYQQNQMIDIRLSSSTGNSVLSSKLYHGHSNYNLKLPNVSSWSQYCQDIYITKIKKKSYQFLRDNDWSTQKRNFQIESQRQQSKEISVVSHTLQNIKDQIGLGVSLHRCFCYREGPTWRQDHCFHGGPRIWENCKATGWWCFSTEEPNTGSTFYVDWKMLHTTVLFCNVFHVEIEG